MIPAGFKLGDTFQEYEDGFVETDAPSPKDAENLSAMNGGIDIATTRPSFEQMEAMLLEQFKDLPKGTEFIEGLIRLRKLMPFIPPVPGLRDQIYAEGTAEIMDGILAAMGTKQAEAARKANAKLLGAHYGN